MTRNETVVCAPVASPAVGTSCHRESSIKVAQVYIGRTLIDMAVRPVYSGGVAEVLRAYEAARDRARVRKVVSILKKLDYTYPYHQVVGFYMQRAGYPTKELAALKALGLKYDFYLTCRLVKPKYDKDWRLFYPQAF